LPSGTHKPRDGLSENLSAEVSAHTLNPTEVQDVTRSAIMASDMVLIPVQPSPFDVWGARAVVELLGEAAIVRPRLKTAFAINRKIVNTAIGRDVTEALAVYEMRVLAASLAQRVAFAESVGRGCTVFDVDPASAASTEVTELTREIVEIAAWPPRKSRSHTPAP
jgi:chromosome partitioning protein